MTKFKRIVAFGDSNTFGQGLPDIESNFDYNLPSKFAYPNLIGEELNLPIENLAIPGCGNQTILRLLCNYFFKLPAIDSYIEQHQRMKVCYQEGDLILIGLSEASRTEIYDSRKARYERIIIQELPNFYDQTLYKAIKYAMVLESDESLFAKMLHQIMLMKILLSQANADYLIYHSLPPIGLDYLPHVEINKPNRYLIGVSKTYEDAWKKLLDKNYLPYQLHGSTLPHILPCHHPDKDGHKIIAKILLEHINEL